MTPVAYPCYLPIPDRRPICLEEVPGPEDSGIGSSNLPNSILVAPNIRYRFFLFVTYL